MKQDLQTFPIEAFPRRGQSESNAFDRWVLARIQQALESAPIRFRLWDGFERSSQGKNPIATIVIKNRQALLSWARDPELNFGEGYMSGTVEVRGNLVELLEAVYRAWPDVRRRASWRRSASNDAESARANVHSHYDLGNQFYRLWLDRQLLYTCAYFPTPDCELEAAQVAKMDLVCRKLRLAPDERVVEAGCGWGALALHMAKHYGVSVRAFNLSKDQMAYARERAAREGLADRVQFIEDDYRNMTGTYDAFVSVGMLEHVGCAELSALGEVIERSLSEHGRGLLHFIGRNRPMPLNAWIRKRIFPGAYPPALAEVFDRVLGPWNMSVLDVENLRLHYARTLEHWSSRFEQNVDIVQEMFDESFVRAWRLYLAGSQAAFNTGCMQLFQVVFTRGASNAIPWTREAGMAFEDIPVKSIENAGDSDSDFGQ